MSSLTLENVNKYSGEGIRILYDFNLSVNDKEFFVVTGPHKSGKNTVIRLITGAEKITEGSIRINGNIVNEIPISDRNVALLSRYSTLYPQLSVFENLAFALKLKRTPKEKIDESVDKIAKLVGISDILDSFPDKLDKMQSILVALGRILVREPDILILDEPLFEIEPHNKKKLREEIYCLQKKTEITFIYVTECPKEALSFNERIAVINDGTVKQVGVSQELRQNLTCKFITEFFSPDSATDVSTE